MNLDTLEIARGIIDVLDDKKAEDIVLLDIRTAFPFADYFIICSASSERMINALIKAAVEQAHQSYGYSGRIEGMPQDGWVLVDFGDVILHVMAPEQRQFYQIEEVWHEAKILLRVQ